MTSPELPGPRVYLGRLVSPFLARPTLVRKAIPGMPPIPVYPPPDSLRHARASDMGMLDFWHPVLRTRDLPRGRAVAVRVGGRSLALFRPGPGRVAALDDKCSHRRMKLSLGTVRDGRLACPYHGWTFDCAGQ